MDARTILRRHAALGRLGDAALEALARESAVARLHRGDALFRAGERASALCVIGHGLVKVAVPTAGTRDLVLGLFGPGESAGDATLLEGGVHALEAFALTNPVVVARVPRDALEAALEQSAPAALAFARELGKRAALAGKRVALFSASAEERLASALLELGERFGDELDDGATIIPLRLTRAELAALVGTTVETTIRTLSRWSREGLVSTVDGGLTVHDPAALARRAAPPSFAPHAAAS